MVKKTIQNNEAVLVCREHGLKCREREWIQMCGAGCQKYNCFNIEIHPVKDVTGVIDNAA